MFPPEQVPRLATVEYALMIQVCLDTDSRSLESAGCLRHENSHGPIDSLNILFCETTP